MKSLAGTFLVARPVLEDPSFRRAVVLLLQHGPEGAFGLIVNRQVRATGLPFPVYRGGPCESPGMFMLHGHSECATTTTTAWRRASSSATPSAPSASAISPIRTRRVS